MIKWLWRSLNYECVYLHAFETGPAARDGIGKRIDFYNTERPPLRARRQNTGLGVQSRHLVDRVQDESVWL